MIWPFKKKSTQSDQVYAVYNSIVAQSRQVPFYLDMSVPDTVTGRFDMVSMHMCLVLRHLRAETGEMKQFSQSLFDLFFKDMDRSLREMGVGDVSVPKRIQKMGSVFYGLLAKLTEALDEGEQNTLIEVLNRNIYNAENAPDARKLAIYVEKAVKQLNAQSQSDIMSGKLSFEIGRAHV